MTKPDNPPKLGELMIAAEAIKAKLAFLEPIAPEVKSIEPALDKAIAEIAHHIRAERALLDAFSHASDAAAGAREQFKRYKDTPGTGTGVYNLMDDLQRLANDIHDRFDHEAKREPGDFR